MEDISHHSSLTTSWTTKQQAEGGGVGAGASLDLFAINSRGKGAGLGLDDADVLDLLDVDLVK
jgi:hypothetical protein